MTTVCHVFDESTRGEQRVGVSTLLEGGAPDGQRAHLFAVDPAARTALSLLDAPVTLCPRRLGLNVLAAPQLGHALRAVQADLIHTWGPHAAAVARIATRGTVPQVVSLSNPALLSSELKLLRTVAQVQRCAFACGSELLRRRLITGGISPGQCVVLRPAVDFALINTVRPGSLREELGILPDEQALLVSEPVSRAHAHLEAFWAVVQRGELTGKLRMIVPPGAREQARIARLAAGQLQPKMLIVPPADIPFEELTAAADVLLVPVTGDVDPTAIAWALAAGVTVIGAAVPAVTELIAHQVNGYLYHPRSEAGTVLTIARLLQDRPDEERCREVGRGQAYEAFGLRRYLEQTLQLYRNVTSGADANHQIVDSGKTA